MNCNQNNPSTASGFLPSQKIFPYFMIPEGTILRAKPPNFEPDRSNPNLLKHFVKVHFNIIHLCLHFSSFLFPLGCNNYCKINCWDVSIFKIDFVLDENKADLLLVTGLRMCGAIPLLC